ncbi:MAG: response regulator [Parvibaculum sp.]|jgi:CheY-like chemotaxis protein|uniref:response regulator n=1 Tax=Parvibaculum sp. TaxID=2024848 RepID=UPI0034A072C0
MTPVPTKADAEFFRKLKVLVVEDSAEMRRLLAALLESMGVKQIVEAHDGLKGLDAFVEHRPDIVITDGAMQPMDGYEMTRSMRAAGAAEGANPDVPILMISGHIGRESIVHARDQGVTDYLPKPLSASVLYEAIVAAVSKPIHFVETPGYRGPSPTRRLATRSAGDPAA